MVMAAAFERQVCSVGRLAGSVQARPESKAGSRASQDCFEATGWLNYSWRSLPGLAFALATTIGCREAR